MKTILALLLLLVMSVRAAEQVGLKGFDCPGTNHLVFGADSPYQPWSSGSVGESWVFENGNFLWLGYHTSVFTNWASYYLLADRGATPLFFVAAQTVRFPDMCYFHPTNWPYARFDAFGAVAMTNTPLMQSNKCADDLVLYLNLCCSDQDIAHHYSGGVLPWTIQPQPEPPVPPILIPPVFEPFTPPRLQFLYAPNTEVPVDTSEDLQTWTARDPLMTDGLGIGEAEFPDMTNGAAFFRLSVPHL